MNRNISKKSTSFNSSKTNKRRRGNGEGSVYQKDGRWFGCITLGKKENGSLNRKYFSGSTKREVIENMDAFKADLLIFLPAIMSIGLTARHDMFGEAVTFFSIFIGSILFAFKIFDVSTITKD